MNCVRYSFASACLLLSALSIALLPLELRAAEESPWAQETQEISDRIMSPFCPGRTLSACPSDQARQLRIEIDGWFSEGYTSTAVENRLTMMYGPTVFGVPSDSRIGRIGWIAPALFVLVTLLAVIIVLRRMRAVKPAPVDSQQLAALESELERELDSRG